MSRVAESQIKKSPNKMARAPPKTTMDTLPMIPLAPMPLKHPRNLVAVKQKTTSEVPNNKVNNSDTMARKQDRVQPLPRLIVHFVAFVLALQIILLAAVCWAPAKQHLAWATASICSAPAEQLVVLPPPPPATAPISPEAWRDPSALWKQVQLGWATAQTHYGTPMRQTLLTWSQRLPEVIRPALPAPPAVPAAPLVAAARLSPSFISLITGCHSRAAQAAMIVLAWAAVFTLCYLAVDLYTCGLDMMADYEARTGRRQRGGRAAVRELSVSAAKGARDHHHHHLPQWLLSGVAWVQDTLDSYKRRRQRPGRDLRELLETVCAKIDASIALAAEQQERQQKQQQQQERTGERPSTPPGPDGQEWDKMEDESSCDEETDSEREREREDGRKCGRDYEFA